MSSEPLFHAEAILAVPLTLSLDVLQSRLETLADDLMVELVLRTDVCGLSSLNVHLPVDNL
jgi:glycine cleavage system regulatory protein